MIFINKLMFKGMMRVLERTGKNSWVKYIVPVFISYSHLQSKKQKDFNFPSLLLV